MAFDLRNYIQMLDGYWVTGKLPITDETHSATFGIDGHLRPEATPIIIADIKGIDAIHFDAVTIRADTNKTVLPVFAMNYRRPNSYTLAGKLEDVSFVVYELSNNQYAELMKQSILKIDDRVGVQDGCLAPLQ